MISSQDLILNMLNETSQNYQLKREVHQYILDLEMQKTHSQLLATAIGLSNSIASTDQASQNNIQREDNKDNSDFSFIDDDDDNASSIDDIEEKKVQIC